MSTDEVNMRVDKAWQNRTIFRWYCLFGIGSRGVEIRPLANVVDTIVDDGDNTVFDNMIADTDRDDVTALDQNSRHIFYLASRVRRKCGFRSERLGSPYRPAHRIVPADSQRRSSPPKRR